jgi:hypothetical protein
MKKKIISAVTVMVLISASFMSCSKDNIEVYPEKSDNSNIS